MTKIALIGCTGSIGRQTAEVVRRYRERFCFTALVSGHDREALFALSEEFSPKISATADMIGEGKIPTEALFEDCDVALIATGGFAGLSYTLAAIAAGKRIALANKESLVCGGELVERALKGSASEIVPVDSEHSALFQTLGFRRDTPFSKLVLTASGGPFLRYTPEELKTVTPQQALKHPNWNMGAKITVDSATMLNKGYEVIEAKWLYGASYDQIEAVVHPESIVHSIVSFQDGAAIAQLGYPDMRVPIQLALTYPERLPCAPQLDFTKLGTLHFERLPEEKFPCFRLAVEAGKAGGIYPTVMNAAGEEAVRAFLSCRITFPQIAETIEDVLAHTQNVPADCFDSLSAADATARARVKNIYGE